MLDESRNRVAMLIGALNDPPEHPHVVSSSRL